MTEQIIAREVSPGAWQWCQWSTGEAQTKKGYFSGAAEELAEAIPSQAVELTLVVRGTQVVATDVTLDAKQRKHASKLIPFELEDELSSAVDSMHFAYGKFQEERVPVIYTDTEACALPIQEMQTHGCDVHTVLPDYLLLQRDTHGITVLLDDEQVIARFSDDWGFSIEVELAAAVLGRMTEHSALGQSPPSHVRLVAENEDDIAIMKTWLPEAWQQDETIVFEEKFASFWECVEISPSAEALNLRRGQLARKLPFARWWKMWKKPTWFLAVAFVIACAAQVTGYFSAKSQEKVVRENMQAVYLKAVPNGRLGDLERLLESRLKSKNNTRNEPTNFSYLLSKATGVIVNDKKVSLSSYSYNGEQRSLQLTMEFESLAALSQFRAMLQSQGIVSDSPRSTSVGDKYQARLKVREAK